MGTIICSLPGKVRGKGYFFLAIIFRLLDVAYISKILFFFFCLLKVIYALSLVLSKAMVRKIWASLVAQMMKNLPAMQETWVWSLGLESISLEKEMATHTRILAWEILWTEEPGRNFVVRLKNLKHLFIQAVLLFGSLSECCLILQVAEHWMIICFPGEPVM